ncbi:ABC transporter permease [Myxococcota bacterium]|nr:ABC transporter permease [Myxococcota bacterium]
MNGRHLLLVIGAEARAIYGRASAKLAVVVALLTGVVVLLALQWLQGQAETIQANGNPITNMVEFSGPAAAGWALRVRNFFVLPLVLLLATAASFAGEIGDQTLREVLVRPVPRWWILLSKALVLSSLAALTLLLTLAPALGGGLALFGAEGPTTTGAVLLGYAASLLSDVGLIALGLLASTFVRSVGGVVVAMMLILMGDMGLRVVLKGMAWVGAAWAEDVGRALPGAALACWEGWQGEWDPWAFAGMAVLLLVGFGGTLWRFQRMDVP